MLKHFLKIFQFLIVLHLITPIIIIKITHSNSGYFKIMIFQNIQADVKVNNKKVYPSFDSDLYLNIKSEPGEIEIIIYTNLTSLSNMFSTDLADSIKIKTSDAYIVDLYRLFYRQNSLKSVDLSEFDIYQKLQILKICLIVALI